mmetsp:Transcript_119274/g.380203  ORF Transcript_119274/g.380203 Transcript_119274/m.380203 type:complete len:344 (+) Transcript_119274:562-1593(+)
MFVRVLGRVVPPAKRQEQLLHRAEVGVDGLLRLAQRPSVARGADVERDANLSQQDRHWRGPVELALPSHLPLVCLNLLFETDDRPDRRRGHETEQLLARLHLLHADIRIPLFAHEQHAVVEVRRPDGSRRQAAGEGLLALRAEGRRADHQCDIGQHRANGSSVALHEGREALPHPVLAAEALGIHHGLSFRIPDAGPLPQAFLVDPSRVSISELLERADPRSDWPRSDSLQVFDAQPSGMRLVHRFECQHGRHATQCLRDCRHSTDEIALQQLLQRRALAAPQHRPHPGRQAVPGPEEAHHCRASEAVVVRWPGHVRQRLGGRLHVLLMQEGGPLVVQERVDH